MRTWGRGERKISNKIHEKIFLKKVKARRGKQNIYLKKRIKKKKKKEKIITPHAGRRKKKKKQPREINKARK